jgi:hypothetical protein
MMTYEQLITKVGPGFHPDGRAEDYTSLPAGVSAKTFDKIVDEAHECGDAYERAFNTFVVNQWIKNP